MLEKKSLQNSMLLMFVAFFMLYGQFASAVTAAQIAQFKKLPPAQQKVLAKQMGVDLNQVNRGGAKAAPVKSVTTVVPRAVTVAKKTDAIEKNAAKATQDVMIDEPVQKKVIRKKIKQFGYDLFAGTPTTFAPATDIPVPSDYVMGPGDTVVVQLFGKDNQTYKLAINREGNLAFPGVGPVSVAGLSFAELKDYLSQIVSEKMIGVKGSFTLGSLRSIRIFVLGEAFRPGSYTVSALSTMTNALFVSGGITKIGSLRNIQLKRRGKVVANMDLYDLLLQGDSSNDARLLPGDVIFIPPTGKTVGVAGEVRRPAIYELKGEKTAGDLVTLAGGMLPTSYPKASRIERIDENRKRTLVDVNLKTKKGKREPVRDGDVIQVFSILDRMENVVVLSGHVRRPGGVEWHKNIRVTDVLPSLDELLPSADLNYALVKRENKLTHNLDVLPLSLAKAFAKPKTQYNLKLQPRDEILVFGLNNGRQRILKSINNKLRLQARFEEPAKVVTISGNVRVPGQYPLYSGMKVSDLINASLDFKEDTDLRYAVVNRKLHNQAKHEVLVLNLTKRESYDTLLQAEDKLYIFNLNGSRNGQVKDLIAQLKRQSRFDDPTNIVTIIGNVRFSGEYPLLAGMQVGELIDAAHGYKEDTDLTYAVVNRKLHNQAKHEVLVLNLTSNEDLEKILQPEDRLYIFQLNESRKEQVKDLITQLKRQGRFDDPPKVTQIFGSVRVPGEYPLYKGMTVKGLVETALGYQEDTDMNYAVINRKLYNKAQHEVLILDLTNNADLAQLIHTEDKLYVFNLKASRSDQIKELISQLKSQANKDIEDLTASISGDVRFPGIYPLVKDMKLSQLVSSAGGFKESAYMLEAEVTRFASDLTESAQSNVFTVDLRLMKEKNEKGDIVLHPRDRVLIKRIPDWRKQEYVTLSGEVKFPGVYSFVKGERLSSVIKRAGGLTQYAYPKGSVFTRVQLKIQEQQRLKDLRDQLSGNIAKAQLATANSSTKDKAPAKVDEIGKAQALLAKIDNAKVLGRLVINLPEILNENEDADVSLIDGDKLAIPMKRDAITVIGEVQYPNSQRFVPGSVVDDYIDLSGGMTVGADGPRVYIVKANGAVKLPGQSLWFSGLGNEDLEPGDAIVVPLDLAKMDQLKLWTNVSQIFYQVALGAAAVGSF